MTMSPMTSLLGCLHRHKHNLAFTVAMLPMQSVELAMSEMRFARETLGMSSGFLRPNPYHGKKMLNDPMYAPFWTLAAKLSPPPALWLPRFDHFCLLRWKIMKILTDALMIWLK